MATFVRRAEPEWEKKRGGENRRRNQEDPIL
jgi:hypothetical protein